MSRRVVITGLGAITPLGLSIKSSWDSLINSKSGIKPLLQFSLENYPVKVAASINESVEGGFDPEQIISKRDIKKMDRFIHLGIAAAIEAIEDSGIEPETDEQKQRIGVLIGSGIGGLNAIEHATLQLRDSGRVSPFFIPSTLINLLSGHVSMRYDLQGPNHSVVTACATGLHAIGDAMRIIKYGDADVMVAGGAEASITPVGMAGFAAAKALSSGFNDTPEKASRPWDKDRDGFVMGEGAGVVVLEEYEHAKKRGATIYCELAGYGLSGDAHHMTMPHPEGRGGKKAVLDALHDAQLDASAIHYINAHGTSTPPGDLIELNFIQDIFRNNDNICMSSTKSSTGHLLGASGSMELIFTTLALQNSIAPPTLNLDNPCDEAFINLVPHTAQERQINHAVCNSFGFGGTNASVVISKL